MTAPSRILPLVLAGREPGRFYAAGNCVQEEIAPGLWTRVFWQVISGAALLGRGVNDNAPLGYVSAEDCELYYAERTRELEEFDHVD